MSTRLKRQKMQLDAICHDKKMLHEWIELYLGLRVPRHAVCEDHDAPFDYLWHAYHEPAGDVIVWAPRGGGKTRLGAVATLLDLLHKPGCAVRILGGSLEQAMKMWEHLLPDLQRMRDQIEQMPGARQSVRFKNGADAAVLTQSQKAVRGLRVQKIRCDEVEMFDPKVWEAAQLATRTQGSGFKEGSGFGVQGSGRGEPCVRPESGEEGDHEDRPYEDAQAGEPAASSSLNPEPRTLNPSHVVAGVVEALSTHHKPFGMMHRIVETAGERGTRVIKWCLLEVLEKCPPGRDCHGCELWDDCQRVAKTKCDGFFSIDDAIRLKKRVSRETWEAEMLCRRPNVSGCVFPHFVREVHVCAQIDAPADWQALALDFGFASPFVCLWIATHIDGRVHVFDEYVQEARTMHEHVEHIEARRWGKIQRVGCDPAGNGRNDQTAASNVQVLRSRGYSVHTRHSGIPDGLEMIRHGLRPASGPPRLFIHPRCKRLIKAMQSYHYAESGSELPVKDGEHDHLIDALRYHYVNSKSWVLEGRRY